MTVPEQPLYNTENTDFMALYYVIMHIYLWGVFPTCDSQPSRPKQNSQHFVHNIFKYNSLIENCCIFIHINIFNCRNFLIDICVSWLRFHRFFHNNKSSLVQMLTSEQATSHNLNHCWIRFMTPYGVKHNESVKRLGYTSSKLLSRTRVCSESI